MSALATTLHVPTYSVSTSVPNQPPQGLNISALTGLNGRAVVIDLAEPESRTSSISRSASPTHEVMGTTLPGTLPRSPHSFSSSSSRNHPSSSPHTATHSPASSVATTPRRLSLSDDELHAAPAGVQPTLHTPAGSALSVHVITANMMQPSRPSAAFDSIPVPHSRRGSDAELPPRVPHNNGRKAFTTLLHQVFDDSEEALQRPPAPHRGPANANRIPYLRPLQTEPSGGRTLCYIIAALVVLAVAACLVFYYFPAISHFAQGLGHDIKLLFV